MEGAYLGDSYIGLGIGEKVRVRGYG